MKTFIKSNLDYLGVCVSGFCAIHCLLTPFLLILLPVVGLNFLESEGFEIGILIISFIIALVSLGTSYLNQHHSFTPLALAFLGFAFFASAQAVQTEFLEIGISIIGGVFIILAHLKNRKLIQQH